MNKSLNEELESLFEGLELPSDEQIKKDTRYANVRNALQGMHEKLSKRSSGERNSFYGKQHSEQSREKKRIALKGKKKLESSVQKRSGGNHYSKRSEHKGFREGNKNGRFNPTVYCWEHIETGRQVHLTRYDFIKQIFNGKHHNVSQLILGKYDQCKGWKIIR